MLQAVPWGLLGGLLGEREGKRSVKTGDANKKRCVLTTGEDYTKHNER